MQFSIWTNIFCNGFSFQLIPTTFVTRGFSQGHFISSLLLHHSMLLWNSDLCVHSYTYFILYDGLICIVAILYIQIGPMKMASTDSDDHQRLLGLFIRTKYVKFIPGSFQWQYRFVGYLSSVPLVTPSFKHGFGPVKSQTPHYSQNFFYICGSQEFKFWPFLLGCFGETIVLVFYNAF